MIPLLVVRPEPGCGQTVAAAQSMGLRVLVCPLFAVRSCDWSLPQTRFDAILAGSANAFRYGGPALAGLTDLPVHAVGEATAEAAREAGFAVASIGEGGLQAVLDRLEGPLKVLRLSGSERVALAAPVGIELAERTVYSLDPLPLDSGLADSLRRGAVVMLHSAAQARHFAGEVDRLGLPRAAISLALIGPRLTPAAGEGWASLATAERPTDAALLALARTLCQGSGP